MRRPLQTVLPGEGPVPKDRVMIQQKPNQMELGKQDWTDTILKTFTNGQ